MKFELQGAAGRMIGARGKTMSGGHARRGWWPTLASAAVAALAMFLVPVWAYALPVCGSTISSCCKITTSGSYSVSTNFPASGYTACIRIKAPNVSLDGGSHTITGPGAISTMKGLVIEPGADNAFVERLTMSGFDTGIEVDANKAELLSVLAVAGGTGIVINGKRTACLATFGQSNANNGIVVNGRGFSGEKFGGIGNQANGVVVNATAVGIYTKETIAYSNGKAGVKINNLTGGWFQFAAAYNNGTYGVWLRGTERASLSDFTVYSNGIAGVYLGCHGDFPSSAPCAPWILPTNANVINSSTPSSFRSTANGGSSPVQQYGVVIDRGNYLNTVLEVDGANNVVDDAYDGKPGCDSNYWDTSNNFTSTNQSCVQ